MTSATNKLIENYYNAFNEFDMPLFFDLLTDDVAHDINQGKTEICKEAFKKFMAHMDACYKERAYDIAIMASEDGQHAAATFMSEGKYLKTDGNLPAATGQTYRLPVGCFFTIKNNKVARVTNYYNLNDWLAQVK
jgi:steroid delta-isomerase-like uncharacterized protein